MGMKTKHQKQTLTLGKLIESVSSVYGQRRASAIIRRAMADHVVVFREEHHALALLHRRFTH